MTGHLCPLQFHSLYIFDELDELDELDEADMHMIIVMCRFLLDGFEYLNLEFDFASQLRTVRSHATVSVN